MPWSFNASPLRVAKFARDVLQDPMVASEASSVSTSFLAPAMDILKNPPHSSHPNFAHLTLLVFEAVLEVCVVAAPGYILARNGGFTAEQQTYLSKINIAVFTPCLIFSKLARQLTGDKLLELAVIPLIFFVQKFISWASAELVSRLCFKFEKRARNFVIAMAVSSQCRTLARTKLMLAGLRQLKLPSHLSRHFPRPHHIGSSLGPNSRR